MCLDFWLGKYYHYNYAPATLKLSPFPDHHAKPCWFLSLECISKFRSTETHSKQYSLFKSTHTHVHTHTHTHTRTEQSVMKYISFQSAPLILSTPLYPFLFKSTSLFFKKWFWQTTLISWWAVVTWSGINTISMVNPPHWNLCLRPQTMSRQKSSLVSSFVWLLIHLQNQSLLPALSQALCWCYRHRGGPDADPMLWSSGTWICTGRDAPAFELSKHFLLCSGTQQ